MLYIQKRRNFIYNFFRGKKRKGKNVKQIVIRGRKIRNLYDTNANKSCAAKLHFIRIFYWRLFLIYIKLTIGGARKKKPRSKIKGKWRIGRHILHATNQKTFKFVGSTRFFRYKKENKHFVANSMESKS